MSIQLELTVYGPQLAGALMNDDEELAYFLDDMAKNGSAGRLASGMADLLPDAECVIVFLRALADAIEAAE